METPEDQNERELYLVFGLFEILFMYIFLNMKIYIANLSFKIHPKKCTIRLYRQGISQDLLRTNTKECNDYIIQKQRRVEPDE